MMFPTARDTLLVSTLLGMGALFSAAACTSENDTDPPKATGGASGTTGGSGNASGGSNSGTGGSGGTATGSPGAKACPTPTMGLITDFTYTAGPMSKTDLITFGTFTPDSLSGGTFIFPSPAEVPTPMYPLTSDVTGSNWHIEGPIGNYSGFGLFLQDCQKIDASAFKGIRFTVSGTVAMGSTITLAVGTAADEIAASWHNARKATGVADKEGFGRCMPASENQYDGSCAAPSKAVPVTPTPTPVTVLWSELTGGKPQPGVTSSEITSISWSFPPPAGAGTDAAVPYDADIVIDDLEFVE
jgi:hypothetical protein